MYGSIGKLTAVDGKRDELIAVLLSNAHEMPGCLSYVVAKDPGDTTTIWVTEVWQDQDSHKASLALPGVRAAIAKGKPLIAKFDRGVVTEPVGGHGLQAEPRR
jgi:quinol monooxygenase YgiN